MVKNQSPSQVTELLQGKTIHASLEEAVMLNKELIDKLIDQAYISDLGIRIMQATPIPTPDDLDKSYTGEYGDAYFVGEDTPYHIYVWTRQSNIYNGVWFDFGELNPASTIPGPPGPQGLQGKTGERGNTWSSSNGVPVSITDRIDGDQHLNTSTGDIYQFNGTGWQPMGSIRGPQGIQGLTGKDGPQGPVGPVGPEGPKGNDGGQVRILGNVDTISELPMPDEVPLNAAYLLPGETEGTSNLYVIIGKGTSEDPYKWHNAGYLVGGTQVTIDGVKYYDVDMSYISKTPYTYQIGEDTTVSSNSSEVTFSNLQATGTDLGGNPIDSMATIELPIAASQYIELSDENNVLSPILTDEFWEEIESKVGDAKPTEVQILDRETATQGQLDSPQLAELQNNKGAYLMFNNEIYRLQDTQHVAGYLVYTHIGYENTTQKYVIKCITITVSTGGWVLTTREVANAADLSKYLPLAGGTMGANSTLEIPANGTLKMGGNSGWHTDQYGNFVHNSTDAGNNWNIMSGNGDPKFSVHFENGDVSSGAIIANGSITNRGEIQPSWEFYNGCIANSTPTLSPGVAADSGFYHNVFENYDKAIVSSTGMDKFFFLWSYSSGLWLHVHNGENSVCTTQLTDASGNPLWPKMSLSGSTLTITN